MRGEDSGTDAAAEGAGVGVGVGSDADACSNAGAEGEKAGAAMVAAVVETGASTEGVTGDEEPEDEDDETT